MICMRSSITAHASEDFDGCSVALSRAVHSAVGPCMQPCLSRWGDPCDIAASAAKLAIGLTAALRWRSRRRGCTSALPYGSSRQWTRCRSGCASRSFRARRCYGHILRGALSEDVARQSPAAHFADAWQAEAARCWDPDPDGEVPGFIADMLPEEGELTLSARAERPQMHRRWNIKRSQLPQEEWARDRDCKLAMHFFSASLGGNAAVVADVSCGDAFFARRFQASGNFGQVYALDISWPVLEYARGLAESSGVAAGNLRLVQGDAEDLPFREKSMDCVMWGMGLHMVSRPSAALRSICSCLRPTGGLLYATCANQVRDVKEPGAAGLAQMVEEAGLAVVDVREEGSARFVLEAVRP